ncbi:UNVERIFIED_CONTAM: hypothetical protein ABIC26_001941 [Paenibacillus sp. PvR008]
MAFNPTNDYQNTTVLAFTCMFSFMMLNINSLPLIARQGFPEGWLPKFKIRSTYCCVFFLTRCFRRQV